MLLCLSRRRFGVLWHTELAIELANNIALQAPRDLPFALALGGTFDHVALCGFVIAHSGDSNAVEGGGANGALDNVAVHLDGTVIKKQLQAVHVFCNVTELLAKA
jgi:hypothetical protein